jgi:glycosyltransferase involved in cell wall biosynthesis
VAYLGRLAPQKDVGTLLHAFARLPAGPQLLLVGDGPDRAALQRLAQRRCGRVHFTGFVPHAQVRRCCSTQTCWCCPACMKTSARR